MIPDGFGSGDVNIEKFDPHHYPEYTIFRILEFGDPAREVAAGEFLRSRSRT